MNVRADEIVVGDVYAAVEEDARGVGNRVGYGGAWDEGTDLFEF